jgi:hypothetical protein
MYKDIDRGFIERVGPSGIIEVTSSISNLIVMLQTGLLFHYLFMFFMFLFILGLSWVVSNLFFFAFTINTFLFIYLSFEEV